MALSNMRNEPRRELTESGIGIAVTVLFFILDYNLAHKWAFSSFQTSNDQIGFTVVGMLLGCIAIPIFIGIAYMTHSFGETVCGWLTAVGYDPRPDRNLTRRR